MNEGKLKVGPRELLKYDWDVDVDVSPDEDADACTLTFANGKVVKISAKDSKVKITLTNCDREIPDEVMQNIMDYVVYTCDGKVSTDAMAILMLFVVDSVICANSAVDEFFFELVEVLDTVTIGNSIGSDMDVFKCDANYLHDEEFTASNINCDGFIYKDESTGVSIFAKAGGGLILMIEGCPYVFVISTNINRDIRGQYLINHENPTIWWYKFLFHAILSIFIHTSCDERDKCPFIEALVRCLIAQDGVDWNGADAACIKD